MENKVNFANMNNFNWQTVFIGEKKEDSNNSVIIKKIKIYYNYESILKEIYFLPYCSRSKYFIKLVDLFISDDNNYIYLILKDEGISLS